MRVNMFSTPEIGLYSYSSHSKESPPTAQYVIDVSHLRDPLSNRGFKNTEPDGCSPAVKKFVRDDPRVGAIVETVEMLAYMLLRSPGVDHKTYAGTWLSVAFRDHHGRWIAPSVAEIVADKLSPSYRVAVQHFELKDRK